MNQDVEQGLRLLIEYSGLDFKFNPVGSISFFLFSYLILVKFSMVENRRIFYA